MPTHDFQSDLAARRARLEQVIAQREEAVFYRFRTLKSELGRRLDVSALLRRQALPLSIVSFGVGFWIAAALRRPRPTPPVPPAAASPERSKGSRSLWRTLLQSVWQSAQSLALNYATDWLSRQVQVWLQPSAPKSSQPSRNDKSTENVAQ